MNCLKLKDLMSPRIGKYELTSESPQTERKTAQKENLFVEPKKTLPKTPVKNISTTSAMRWRGCSTPDRDQVTPVKHSDKSLAEPWSPTANLKMLISAASPDIRDREKRKDLFRQIENDRLLSSINEAATDEFEQQRPSRKQKSLGLLCQKFLARYPNYPVSTEKTEISLDEVATELGVERRRIYDIVNVLESLQLVSRMAKNQYSWHGMLRLEQTLATLKRRGEQHGYAKQLALARHKELDSEEVEKGDAAQEKWSCCRELNREPQPVEVENKSASLNRRKDKSLRIMTEKFVMLFLVSEPETVALDIAAKILIEESQQDSADNSKFKTKIRRLYDIANVLTSLGLIKKVHVTEEKGRKPAFKWVGPVYHNQANGFPDHSVSSAPTRSSECVFPVTVNTKDRLECSASLSTQRGSRADQLKAQSAPCSPAKFQTARTIEGKDYSSKMVHLAAACRLKFEQEIKNSESDRRQEDGQLQSVAMTSYPLLMTCTAASADCAVKTLTENGSSVPQGELSLPVCLSNGGVGHLTPAGGTDSSYSYQLKNQPVVLLQSVSAAPVLMLYRNSDCTPGPSDTQTQQHQETSSPITTESEASSLTRNSKKRGPAEQCPLPPEPCEDGGPETKRGKILSCLEHASGNQPPVLCLSSSDKSSTQYQDPLRNCARTPDQISLPAASHSSQTINVNLENSYRPAGDQTHSCYLYSGNADGQNATVTVTKGPIDLSVTKPLTKDSNQESPVVSGNLTPASFVLRTPCGLAGRSQSCGSVPRPGTNELNLLLSTNPNLAGITISPGHVGSVTLPYQVMMPVLCQPLVAPESIGNTIPNNGLVPFNLRNLKLLPNAQLLMGSVSVSALNEDAVKPSSPTRQIYSHVPTQTSQEDLCNKPDPVPQVPIASRLHEESLNLITARDDAPSFVESYFHTPVPVVQRKRVDGIQVKAVSPAQRRLEIENNIVK
ncbi:transcription factor E2F7-like isoform X1 [Stegostoma tigrinum]|uniref:transcription factor E2F7-like isoform X1 n=1 Tax=Stegostoma tigrinum TaxID=3053191 RepID=UPI00286FF59D|nr:transcription factor E2F7-like isoform X1 [Stegostoma tigrinum]